jgi:hypothetical protein
VVDIEDFNILKDVFGTNDPNADFDDSGTVDLLDFDILKQNLGTGAISAVPEPTTAGLVLLGLALAVSGRFARRAQRERTVG